MHYVVPYGFKGVIDSSLPHSEDILRLKNVAEEARRTTHVHQRIIKMETVWTTQTLQDLRDAGEIQ